MNGCLITGAGGFIGSYLAAYLSGKGLAVSGTVHRNPRPVVPLPEGVTLLACDLTDPQQVAQVVAGTKPDAIFHLAAQSLPVVSWKDPEGTLRANVLGTLHLLEAVRQAGLDPVLVVAGSSSEYGPSREDEVPIREDKPFRPSSPYAVSKIAQDMLAYAYFRSYQMRAIRVRPFYIIGPGKAGDAASEFARQIVQIERGGLDCLRVGNLEAVRDVVDVQDAVRALWLLAERGEAGEVYNLCSGIGISIRGILDKLIFLSKSKAGVEVQVDPARLRPADEPVLVGDSSRLRALGWQPTIPLEKTLADVLSYWRKAG